MKGVDVFWLCIASSFITMLTTVSLCHRNDKIQIKSLKDRAYRFSYYGTDTLVDNKNGQIYYSDSLVRSIPRQAQMWYVASSGVDAMIINDIMKACQSTTDIAMVQWLIDIEQVKKENLATLLRWSAEDGERRIPMHTIAEIYYTLERLTFYDDYNDLRQEDEKLINFLMGNQNHYIR